MGGGQDVPSEVEWSGMQGRAGRARQARVTQVCPGWLGILAAVCVRGEQGGGACMSKGGGGMYE